MADYDRRGSLKAYKAHVNKGLARLGSMMGSPLEVRAEGAVVYDEHGAAMRDCGGYGVFILGHCQLTALTPSMTLGCGTYGGTSTTDNVGYRNLINVKRVAGMHFANLLNTKRLTPKPPRPPVL